MRWRFALTTASFVFILVPPAGATAATTETLPSGTPATTGTQPWGIALDSAGNIYTGNSSGNVSKILAVGGSLAGGVQQWAFSPGIGTQSLVLDAEDNLYVTGSGEVGKIQNNGNSGSFVSSPWPVLIGGLTNQTVAIARDKEGNLYATNLDDDSVYKVTPNGQVGSNPPWPVQVGNVPDGITIGMDGNIYVANNFDDSVSKVTPQGDVVEDFGATGDSPSSLVTDTAGNIYTANCGSHSISRIPSTGSPSQVAWASVGANTCPLAITIDSMGNLYTANQGTNSITKVSSSGSSTVSFAFTGSQPQGITIDSSGNLYTANFGSNNVTKVIPAPADGVAPAPPDIPSAPSAVAGSGSATVTVTANAVSARFGAPSSYTVEAVQDPTKSCTVSPPATSCAVTGLTAGSSYTFTARSNLNAWETGASSPSNAVTPTAPDPGPDPNPDPNPDPTPTPSISVTSLKAKVQKQSVSFSSKATVSGAGTISQKAKQGKKVWCTTSKTVSGAGTYGLTCNLGKKGRSALRKKALKLSVTTTFKPGTGSPVSKPSTITIKRKR